MLTASIFFNALVFSNCKKGKFGAAVQEQGTNRVWWEPPLHDKCVDPLGVVKRRPLVRECVKAIFPGKRTSWCTTVSPYCFEKRPITYIR